MDEPNVKTIRKNLGVAAQIPFFGYLIYRTDTDEFLAKYEVSPRGILKGWHKFPDQAKPFNKILNANKICQELQLDPAICEIVIGFDLGKQIMIGPLDSDIVAED